jgi:predicted nucleic acid-binding protein
MDPDGSRLAARSSPGKKSMLDRVFVDTNVLIYLHDAGEAKKRAIARDWFEALLEAGNIVVSTQVLNEFYVAATRRFPRLARDQLRAFIDDLRPLSTGTSGLVIIDRARQVEDQSNYHWYDCLIVAAAIEAGCRYLLTEDLDHGRSFNALTVINPFRASPASVLLIQK